MNRSTSRFLATTLTALLAGCATGNSFSGGTGTADAQGAPSQDGSVTQESGVVEAGGIDAWSVSEAGAPDAPLGPESGPPDSGSEDAPFDAGIDAASCTGTLTLCGGACVNTSTNRANCGGCAGDGGQVCTATQTCAAGSCVSVTACTIGGSEVDAGAIDPANACESCQPGVDAAAWSAVASGTSCGDGGTCSGGVCEPASTCGPSLHVPYPGGGLYCPFSYGADGGIEYCTSDTQMCCVSPANDAGLNSTCTAFGGSCPSVSGYAFSVWQCSSPADCAGVSVSGSSASDPAVCCLTAGALESATADGGCTYQKTKGFDYTKCALQSACTGTSVVGSYNDPNYIACEQSSDCPASSPTCTAIKTSGTPIGICQ